MDPIYVTGHRNPDTDSIVAAIAYTGVAASTVIRTGGSHLSRSMYFTGTFSSAFSYKAKISLSLCLASLHRTRNLESLRRLE